LSFNSANKVRNIIHIYFKNYLIRKNINLLIGVDEKVVLKKAYDLFLAFDDVITHGYRESVTMAQIESYLEMDSTDEKMHKKMQLIQEAEAKEYAKKQ
jgi:hypothetical protein